MQTKITCYETHCLHNNNQLDNKGLCTNGRVIIKSDGCNEYTEIGAAKQICKYCGATIEKLTCSYCKNKSVDFYLVEMKYKESCKNGDTFSALRFGKLLISDKLGIK